MKRLFDQIVNEPFYTYDRPTRTTTFNPLGCLVWVILYVLLFGVLVHAARWAIGWAS